MKELIIFGIGSTAQVLYDHLSREGQPVAAFTVDAAYRETETLLGQPVLPFEEIATHFPPEQYQMQIAIGYAQVNRLRAARVAQAKTMGYELFSYISPSALVWDGLELKEHCQIGARSLIEPYAFLGTGAIVRNRARIATYSVVGAGAVILNDTREKGVYAAREAEDLGLSSDVLSPG